MHKNKIETEKLKCHFVSYKANCIHDQNDRKSQVLQSSQKAKIQFDFSV